MDLSKWLHGFLMVSNMPFSVCYPISLVQGGCCRETFPWIFIIKHIESHKYEIGPQGQVLEMLKMSCQISSIWNLNAIKNMGLMKCNGGTSWFGNGGEARCQMHRCTISLLTSTWCTLHTLLMYHLPFTSVWYSGNTILLNNSVFVLLQYVSFFKHVYCTVYIHAFDIFSIGVLSPF